MVAIKNNKGIMKYISRLVCENYIVIKIIRILTISFFRLHVLICLQGWVSPILCTLRIRIYVYFVYNALTIRTVWCELDESEPFLLEILYCLLW